MLLMNDRGQQMLRDEKFPFFVASITNVTGDVRAT